MKATEEQRTLGRHWIAAGGVFAVLLVLGGCGGGSQAGGSAPSKTAQTPALPAGLFIDQAAEGAKSVLEAKKDFKPGETIVIRGRIGGSQPFVKGRAAMTLYDLKLPACNENHDDACPKPWDYCCETKETRIAHAASVQVLSPEGTVVAADLEGTRDLAPLDVLVVKGTVNPTSQGANLIVDAQSIFIEKRGNRTVGAAGSK